MKIQEIVGTGEGLGREPHRVDKVRNLLADRLVVIDDSYNGLFGHGPPLLGKDPKGKRSDRPIYCFEGKPPSQYITATARRGGVG